MHLYSIMPLEIKSQDKYKKITDYTTINKLTESKIDTDSSRTQTTKTQKRPISPNQHNLVSTSKRPKSSPYAKMDDNSSVANSSSTSNSAELNTQGGSDCDTLQKALGSLLNEFRSLRDSVKLDYADLKQTITKQKEELQKELVHKIDNNTKQLSLISDENKLLRKENTELKSRLDKIELGQLRKNVLVTGIQKGPYEQWPQDLVHHIKQHMQVKWQCKNCDMVFAEKRLLKCHEHKHIDTYRFRCNKCDFKSKWPTPYKRHLKLHS